MYVACFPCVQHAAQSSDGDTASGAQPQSYAQSQSPSQKILSPLHPHNRRRRRLETHSASNVLMVSGDSGSVCGSSMHSMGSDSSRRQWQELHNAAAVGLMLKSPPRDGRLSHASSLSSVNSLGSMGSRDDGDVAARVREQGDGSGSGNGNGSGNGKHEGADKATPSKSRMSFPGFDNRRTSVRCRTV